MTALADSNPAAPRYARPFVALFLATLVVCALAAWNCWPFSNWELFSRLRTDRQIVWDAVAVDRSGRERDYAIASLPHGYRGFVFIAARLAQRSAGVRNEICVTWLRGAVARYGPGTQLVRIYELERLLSDRQGKRAAPPYRTLAWTCSTKGARAAD
ncbi:MAG: hypothetical protein ACYDA3_06670 [Gaiellaceae bacterium]